MVDDGCMRLWALLALAFTLVCTVPAVAFSDGPPAPIVPQPGDHSGDTLPDDGVAPTSVVQAPRGKAVVGAKLGVPPSFVGSRLQWQSCRGARCANVAGATKTTFTVTAALVGRTVRVVATTDAGVRLVSKPTAAVRAKR